MSAVDEALKALRSAIQSDVEQAIVTERMTDRLTGLGSNDALDAALRDAVEGEDPFWFAFVEVDRFKAINDAFGYDQADSFLKAIADVLEGASKEVQAAPFRAHGDEFFLLGWTAAEPTPCLEEIRRRVEGIALSTTGIDAKVLRGTVSVGWVKSEDLRDLSVNDLKTAVEYACSEAKVNRNTVVQYVAGMKPSMVEGRGDCAGCRTKFTFHAPVSADRTKGMFCPTCGTIGAPPPI